MAAEAGVHVDGQVGFAAAPVASAFLRSEAHFLRRVLHFPLVLRVAVAVADRNRSVIGTERKFARRAPCAARCCPAVDEAAEYGAGNSMGQYAYINNP